MKPACIQTDVGLIQSEKNLVVIKERVAVLIFVRYLVHRFITERLQRVITPYEWLLYQLYPKQFLGGDVFKKAVAACLLDGDVNIETATSALRKVDFELPVSFIDEAQHLLTEHRPYFLSTDGTKRRSAFSALLKARSATTSWDSRYFLVAGCTLTN
jgi:hypothetical protein